MHAITSYIVYHMNVIISYIVKCTQSYVMSCTTCTQSQVTLCTTCMQHKYCVLLSITCTDSQVILSTTCTHHTLYCVQNAHVHYLNNCYEIVYLLTTALRRYALQTQNIKTSARPDQRACLLPKGKGREQGRKVVREGNRGVGLLLSLI